jgi:uridine kinase
VSGTQAYIVGIAGGSGSGKTTFARELLAQLPAEHCALIYQDNYYIDQSSRFDYDGGSINFDHPDSLDFPLLVKHLAQLKTGLPIQVPIYDFASHKRLPEVLHQASKKLIFVDGILIFHPEPLRALFDELIYFDAPESIRFKRRLERDVRERGRTPQGVEDQFMKQVKPMHDHFVEPSKNFANVIVRDQMNYKIVLKEYIVKFRHMLGV